MSANESLHSSDDLTAISIQQLTAALLDEMKPFYPRYLYRLSDLEGADLLALQTTWSQVAVQRRQAIMEDIEELGEANLALSFEGLCRYAIHDSDPRVRELAIRILRDYEVDDLITQFISILQSDESSDVRAAAASALGGYIYQGEIEELPETTLDLITDQLLKSYNSSEAVLVRRMALEALGFSSREEIPPMIESAYYSGNRDWIISALFAMGRSFNHQWHPLVLEMLDHDDPEIRFEAVRAAGELEMKTAIERLIDLLNDSNSDIRLAAVWSLSQIGGEGVQDALEELYEETEDEEEVEFIEQALENLTFTEEIEAFSIMELSDEFDEEEDEDFDDEDELEEDKS